MAEQIVLDLKLNTSGAEQSIDQLETSLKNMKDQIKSVPTDSQAFKTLQQQIQKTDAQVKNVNKSLEGFGKAQLAESLGKIVGGASAAVAGFGLLSQALGSTKESAEEMQRSFNTAFGIINGVKGVTEAFGGLDVILPSATAKFKALDTAMKFSVIGIIALAVGGLVMALGSLSSAEEEATTASDRYNESLKKQSETIDDLQESIRRYYDSTVRLNANLEEALNIELKRKDSIAEIEELSAAHLQNLDETIVSDEALLEIYDKLQAAEKNRIKLGLEEQENYASVRKFAQYRVSDLEAEKEELEKLISTTERYRTVTISGGGISGLGTSTIKTQTQEYTALEEKLKAVNDGLEIQAANVINTTTQIKNLNEQTKGSNVSYVLLLGALNDEIAKRGLVTKQTEEEAASKENLAQQREKEIARQRELNDLLAEYAFLRREIDIRITNEGVDLAEERNLALLDREKEYVDAKKDIDRNEILNKQQKADAYLLIDEQYRIDLLDINADYDKKEQDIEEKKREENRKIDKEIANEELALKKRTLLAVSEADYLQSSKDLESEINWLHAQRDAELLNANLTSEEIYLIKLKWSKKENELIVAQEKKDLATRREWQVEAIGLYDELYSVIGIIMDASLKALERKQQEELSIFTNTLDKEYAAIEEAAQERLSVIRDEDGQALAISVNNTAERLALEENLAAEKLRIDKEKEVFEMQQAERLKERQKKQAGLELGLLLGQSIANIAAAILKAQVSPGFPLSIAEIVRISALGLTQVGAITAQIGKISSFRSGGVVEGPSHENGGVKYAMGGQVNELEGGEGVINKSSMSMPGVADAASYLNQLGGGVAFNTSSVKNSQVATLSAIIGKSQNQIIRAYVIENEITDKQKLNEKIRNKAKF